MSSEELEAAVLSLPANEWESLAHKLIASLNNNSSREIEEAWIRKADRTAEETMKGEAEAVPGDEVFLKAAAEGPL